MLRVVTTLPNRCHNGAMTWSRWTVLGVAAVGGLGCASIAGLDEFGAVAEGGGGSSTAAQGGGPAGGGGAGGAPVGGGGAGGGGGVVCDGEGTAWAPAATANLHATVDAEATAVAADAAGRLIVGGWYAGELEHQSIVICDDTMGTRSGFVARFTRDGEHVDTFCFGDGVGDQEVQALAVAGNGDVYVGGSFDGSFFASELSAPIGSPSGFVLLLHASDLAVASAFQIGDAGTQRVEALALGTVNQIMPALWVAGTFEQGLVLHGMNTMYDGQTVANLFNVAIDPNLQEPGAEVVVVTGNESQITNVGGLAFAETTKRVVLGGDFFGTIGVGGNQNPMATARDGYVWSSTDGGLTSRFNQLGGSGTESVLDVATDQSGNVYLVGSHTTNPASLAGDGGAVTFTHGTATPSGFVASQSDGGANLWSQWVTGGAGASFNFGAVAAREDFVAFGGSYEGSASSQGGSCGSPCLSLPLTAGEAPLAAILSSAGNVLHHELAGQSSLGGRVVDVVFDPVCGDAVMALSYDGSLTFGDVFPTQANGIAMVRLAGPAIER